MFTILGYKFEGIQTYNVYMQFEIKQVFYKLLDDKRITELALSRQFKTLAQAQDHYDNLQSQKETL